MRKMMMAVALGMMPVGAEACTYLEPFEMKNIAGAELVVVGEVTGYQDLGSPWGAALVTVQVDDVLKGKAKGEVTFIWNSGMAQGPHESRATGRVLIGAMDGGRIAVSDMAPDARPDLPSIVQPYCGEVWMQPATKATVAEARKALE
ncbi:hypothetical protein [Tabrizicola sp.]|uniref:hypothetical protein n=1 Tax=Tabrizicola sp. TaxID=2005166 RepID=UPI003F2AE98D